MPVIEYLNYDVIVDQGWELDDPDLFEKAAEADLNEDDYGFFDAAEGQYLLEAAEGAGHAWPFSCRDGICSNCAAILVEGKIEMDGAQALSEDEIEERDIRLTCVGRATSEYVRLIYNAKRLEFLQDRIM